MVDQKYWRPSSHRKMELGLFVSVKNKKRGRE